MLLVPVVLGIKEIDEDPTLTDVRERWRRFAQDDHLRLYSKCGFVQRACRRPDLPSTNWDAPISGSSASRTTRSGNRVFCT